MLLSSEVGIGGVSHLSAVRGKDLSAGVYHKDVIANGAVVFLKRENNVGDRVLMGHLF